MVQKYSARYKKGFREGYNNPTQHDSLDLNKIPENDQYLYGLISGVLKRRADIQKGDNNFIWNEADLNKRILEQDTNKVSI